MTINPETVARTLAKDEIEVVVGGEKKRVVVVDDVPRPSPAPAPKKKGVVRPYTIQPELAEQLRSLANPKCYKCKGTGIHSWRQGGMLARVCKCVKDAAAKAEAEVRPLADKLLLAMESRIEVKEEACGPLIECTGKEKCANCKCRSKEA